MAYLISLTDEQYANLTACLSAHHEFCVGDAVKLNARKMPDLDEDEHFMMRDETGFCHDLEARNSYDALGEALDVLDCGVKIAKNDY